MPAKLTEDYIDKIADILWWIRGYRSALINQDIETPITKLHEDILSDMIIKLKKELYENVG